MLAAGFAAAGGGPRAVLRGHDFREHSIGGGN